MAILGIIMLLAIPNITGVIEKNRAKTYVEDAKKMIALAKYKVEKEGCSDTVCQWELGDLDISNEIVKGPYGYEYIRSSSPQTNNQTSYVLYYKESSGEIEANSYFIVLMENMAGTYSGIYYIKQDEIQPVFEDNLYDKNPNNLINKMNTKEKPVGGDQ